MAEIFPPEEAQVRSLFERAEDSILRQRGALAAEVLAEISVAALHGADPLLDRDRSGPPAADPSGGRARLSRVSRSAVLASHSSLAVGVTLAVRKLLGRLEADDVKRWRELVDGHLQKRWDGSERGEPGRGLLRRRVIRDHPDCSLYLAALEEEIDEAIEAGDLDRAQGACAALADQPAAVEAAAGASPRARLRAAVLGKAAAALCGDGPAASRFGRVAEEILQSDDASGLTREEAARARATLEASAASTRGGDGAEPVNALLGIVLKDETPSPTRDPRPGLPGRARPYELGSAVWRAALPGRELRLWASELTESRGGDALLSSARSVPLPFFPAALGGVILFQEFDRVMALQFPEMRELWTHHLQGDPGESINALRAVAVSPGLAVVAQGDRLTALDFDGGEVRWERQVIYDRARRELRAQLPGAAPLPSEPEEAPPPADPPPPGGRPGEGEREDGGEANPRGQDRENAVESEKKDETEDEKKRDEPLPAVLLSSPVCAAGSILFAAAVRSQSEVQFFCLALDRSGGTQWVSTLGSFRSGDHLGLAASLPPPVPRGGSIYLQTNLGVIASLDAVDGTVLWQRRYPRLTPSGRAESVRSRNRWGGSPVLLQGDLVLAAPQDAGFLVALAPRDGSVIWEVPRERHSSLIGADSERCYLGGPNVSAVRLHGPEAGTTAWQWKPSGPEAVFLGRGTLAPGRVLVPENEALIQLDARSGRLLSTTLWDFRGGGGNLLLAGNLLAAAGAGELLVYNHAEEARERAQSLPPEERHLEAAKLHLKGGDLHTAFEALNRWSDLRPADPPPNSPLYRLRFELAEIAGQWIGRKQTDRSIAAADLAVLHRFRVLLEPLIESKVVGSIRAAMERRAAGDLPGALEHLEETLRLESSPVPYPVNDFLKVPSTEVIRDQLLAVREAGPAGEAAFARFEEHAQEALREARRIGTQPAFLRVIERYPFTRGALAARRDLAEYLLNQQNPFEAIRCLLLLLRDHPEAEDFAAIKLRVADLLMESQRFQEAREVLLSLGQERPEALVDEPRRPEEVDPPGTPRRKVKVRELVARRLSQPPLRPEPAFSPLGSGQVPPRASPFENGEVRGRPRGDDRVAAVAPAPPREGGSVSPLRLPLRQRWRSPANLAASGRVFLRPEGARPAHLDGTFFTRSREVIECRRTADGYPLWTVELGLVPGFLSGGVGGAAFLFNPLPRLSARFAGDQLLIQDSRNLLAIDARNGVILWHRSFGGPEDQAAVPGRGPRAAIEGLGILEPGAAPPPVPPLPPAEGAPGRGRIQPLPEMARGLAAWPGGAFVSTSRRRIISLSPEGSERWQRGLEFEPAPDSPPEVFGEALVVFQEAPMAVHFFDAASGAPAGRLEVKSGPDARLIQRPVLADDGILILALEDRLQTVDLAARRLGAAYRVEGVRPQKVWHFPDLPDQIVASLHTQGLPALVGVDLRSGRELWRYAKFPARRSEITVHSDGNRLYVLHGVQGGDKWRVQLIELRSDLDLGRYYPAPLWPNEIEVGSFFSREWERQVIVSQDALFIPDPSSTSVSAYDKFRGSNRNALATAITRFLVDKKNRFAIDTVDDILVVLTDGGDCGFESAPRPGDVADTRERTRMVKRFAEKLDDWENTSRLARRLFVEGELSTAITLLDSALLSEGLPSRESPGRYQELAFALGGMREEAMKDESLRPSLPCRRFRSPPAVDGEMNDSWNYTNRIEMRSLRHVGLIPTPGQPPDVWAGEEDLSATLYTGWDDEHFYFALDVEDSQIFPYDKGANYWKGDCLIIGIDPTGDGGYFQRGDDQLLTLALTVPKRKPAGKGKGGEDDEDEDEKHKPKGLFAVKKKDDNSGVVYEVGIPWSSFGGEEGFTGPPGRGFRFGLSLLLNDDDSGQGATKTLSPNPSHLLRRDPKRIWQFLIPEFFPKVILE